MHELAIAESILTIARREMEKANATSVKELELEIGKLAGVEYTSLEFALQALTQDTIFKNTSIVIQKPDGQAICGTCDLMFKIESFIGQCPKCNGYKYNIVAGKELRVKSIVID